MGSAGSILIKDSESHDTGRYLEITLNKGSERHGTGSLNATLNKGSESHGTGSSNSTLNKGSERHGTGSLNATLNKGSESYGTGSLKPTLNKGSNSLHSVLINGSDNYDDTEGLQSTQVKISERYITEKLISTLREESDSSLVIFCDICEKVNIYIEAKGYCVDCEEFLCQECYDYHLRPRGMRHHKIHRLLDFFCNICDRNNKRIQAKGYCMNCEEYLCQECYNYHLRPRGMRHHDILGQHMMFKHMSQRHYEEGADIVERMKYAARLKKTSDYTKPSTKHQSMTARTAVGKPEEYTKLAAVHVADFDVSMKNDSNYTKITGSVVLPGDKLVIVDFKNATVKLINLQSNKIVAHLKYNSQPWDITAVTNTQVAVTSPDDSTILFINVTNTLKPDHKRKVNGECLGIASIRDKLVITYTDPAKVEIISQKGKLLQTVVTEDRGRQLFTDPFYVAVSSDQQTLYISEWGKDTVTSLDLSGQVKAKYEDEELKSSHGLAVDKAGVLYVCGYKSNNIHQLTPDLHKIQILLQESDGIVGPHSVSYNEEQNKLCIGMYKSDTVQVYQV